MAFTAGDLVRDSYRLLRRLAEGQDLEGEQGIEGLRVLNALLPALAEQIAGQRLPAQTSGNYTVEEPVVLALIGTAGGTITLPKDPQAGYRVTFLNTRDALDTSPVTLDPQGRIIDGTYGPQTYTIADGTERATIRYWPHKAGWVTEALPTSLSDELQYPDEDRRALAYVLAIELLEYAGREPTANVARGFDKGMDWLRRYNVAPLWEADHGMLDLPSNVYSRANRRTYGGF